MEKVIVDAFTIPSNWKKLLKDSKFKDFEICGYKFLASPIIKETKIKVFLDILKLVRDKDNDSYSYSYKMKVVRAI